LLSSLCDGIAQYVFKFSGVALIVDISGNHYSTPEGGIFFKYLCMYPNFSHGCSAQL
jgi:hypothetical protein